MNLIVSQIYYRIIKWENFSKTYLKNQLFKKSVNADYPALFKEIKVNNEDPKFSVGDRVRISKHKNIFTKACTENWSREIFVIDSVLSINLWIYRIKDLKSERILGRFMKKNCCWLSFKRVNFQNWIVKWDISQSSIRL